MNCENVERPDLPKAVPFIEADLCDTGKAEAVFAQYPVINAVMHFAGLKAVSESIRKPLEYCFNDLTSTLALLRAMQAHGGKNFVFPPVFRTVRSNFTRTADFDIMIRMKHEKWKGDSWRR